MTDILDMPAGPELDRLVATAKGWDVDYSDPGFRGGRVHYRDVENNTLYLPSQWTPSTSLVDAWDLFISANDWVFSKRKRFYDALQEQAHRLTGGSRPAWPDVLTVIRHDFPVAVCRAYLKAATHVEFTHHSVAWQDRPSPPPDGRSPFVRLDEN